MAQITEKELSAISDLLTVEENLVAKYQSCAASTSDPVLKNQYEQLVKRHQRHFDELYVNLK